MLLAVYVAQVKVCGSLKPTMSNAAHAEADLVGCKPLCCPEGSRKDLTVPWIALAAQVWCNTPHCATQLDQHPARRHLQADADAMWARGVLLFSLVCIGGDTKAAVAKAGWRAAEVALCAVRSRLSPAGQAVMARLLMPQPAQRMSMAELLVDPWFKGQLPAGALDMNMR
jgi:hypothetical protein